MSNYNTTLQSNNTDLQAILNTINELPEAVEQATPVISVNTSGLITATVGAKTSTHQLAFQPAKTITPSTASQIAVSSGYYTGGNVTVAGDSNLVAGNIKSGVSIFGVSGNYEGSTEIEDYLVTRKISGTYTNNRVERIGSYAFIQCYRLTSVSFPAATYIGHYAFRDCNLTSVSFPAVTNIGDSVFYNCRSLTSVSFPAATYIGSNAFKECYALTRVNFPAATNIGSYVFFYCSNLTSVSFPAATNIGSYAFYGCSSLTFVSFPAATNIGMGAFGGCSKLNTIYLLGSSICTLSNPDAFSRTSIWSNKGTIYVPSSLVVSYKSATNWVFFSNRIMGR